jgi:hypothetical protein
MQAFEGPAHMNEEYLRQFILQCEQDRAEGKHPMQIAEGDRLADEFRRQFPNVSDRDLGTLLIVFTNMLGYISNADGLTISYVLENFIASYGYCSGVVMRDVIDLEDKS